MSVRDLAERAGVSRGATMRALDGDDVRGTTYARLESALERLEHEMSMDVEPIQVVTTTLTTPEGYVVTFEGDPDGVAEAVGKILSRGVDFGEAG